MDAVRIRAARLSDASGLAGLMCELGYETTSAEMRRRLKSIGRDARCSTFIAKIDNKLCGMIGTLTHVSHEHNDPSGKIVDLLSRKSSGGAELVAL